MGARGVLRACPRNGDSSRLGGGEDEEALWELRWAKWEGFELLGLEGRGRERWSKGPRGEHAGGGTLVCRSRKGRREKRGASAAEACPLVPG